jgi:hypothetical protein
LRLYFSPFLIVVFNKAHDTSEPGLAARMTAADRAKRVKHSLGCRRAGGTFYPFIFSLLGALAPAAIACICDISRSMSTLAAADQLPGTFRDYWITRFGFSIRRDCARRVIHGVDRLRAVADPCSTTYMHRDGAYSSVASSRSAAHARALCRSPARGRRPRG